MGGEKPKKRKNGRKKGASYERLIAKELTAWSGVELRRTPMSGGWAKTGDITPKAPEDMVEWIFNIELKKHQGWHLEDLVKGTNKGKMLTWWNQCKADCAKSKKVKRTPILIFSKNQDASYVWMRGEDWKKFRHLLKIPNLIKFRAFVIFDLTHLLKIDYEQFKECLNG